MHMATQPKPWTLEQLHRLPDDGNKYELVRGELFVTPAPSEAHEEILVRLHALLAPYVAMHQLGNIYRPRAVMRVAGSEVEPDLMVRAAHRPRLRDWDDAPIPLLVVEVLSETTRRRDRVEKRAFYVDHGVGEYWIIDPELENVAVVKPNIEDVVTSELLVWQPVTERAGSDPQPEPLVLRVASIFHDVSRMQ
jgi:Uma2 family endonuclease